MERKKILSIILSLAIIISVLLLVPNYVHAEETLINGGTIYAGDTKTITIENGGEAYWYTFTPDETTYYWFYSEGDIDTYGYILNDDNSVFKSDDDGGQGRNFKIFCTLEKDKTYKIKARIYNNENTGAFTIKLLKISIIDDGALSIGTVAKDIQERERHKATFTPTENGIYRISAQSSKNSSISFEGSTSSGTEIFIHRELTKDTTYNIEYYIPDYTAGTMNISINKYSAISKGQIPIGTDFSVTNNNANTYYEYTFNITEENRYYLVANYNDNVSKNFVFEIYNSEDESIYNCSMGSNRLNTLEPGTYKAKLFLEGSATLKIIKQTTYDAGILSLGVPKTVNFTNGTTRYTYNVTPTISDVYNLYTTNDSSLDTYGYLFDSNGKQLKYSDDDGEGRNFKILYYLEKGKTYTLAAELYTATTSGTVTVNMNKNTDHTHYYYTSTESPTCTEKGYTKHSCNSCGHEYKDTYTDALGHILDTGVVTEPTCTEQGYTSHHCSRCGGTIKDTYVPALGHDSTILSSKKATVSADGYIKKYCNRCHENITETIYHPTKFILSKSDFAYNKKAQKPTVTVKDSKGKTFKLGTDYTVKYLNNNSKKIGKYTVVIEFKGEYEGTKKLTYNINPKGVSLKKLTKGTKQFKATWNKNTTQTTGYEIQYSTNQNFKSGNQKVKIKNNKTTSTTVKNLLKKKKYYVKIRTYKTVSGKKFYSTWSKVLSVKTK